MAFTHRLSQGRREAVRALWITLALAAIAPPAAASVDLDRDTPGPPKPVSTPVPFAPTGRLSFTLKQCTDAVIFKFTAPAKPAAVRTGDIPAVPSRPAPAWTLDWDPPVAADIAISEYSTAGRFSGGCPGPKGVAIPVVVRGPTSVIGRSTVAVAVLPPPKLSVPATLARGLTRAPEPFGQYGDSKVDVPVREATGTTPLPAVRLWADPLKAAGDGDAGFSLQPPPAQPVQAGGSTIQSFTVVGKPKPGVYSGNLYASYLDGGDPKTIPMTLTVHVSLIWLFVLLLLGVFLGWAVNQWLSAKLDLQTARALALQRISVWLGQADAASDPQDRQAFAALAAKLNNDVKASTAAAVDAARARAEADAAEISKQAVARQAEAQTKLALEEARFCLSTPFEPPIADRLAAPQGRLRAIAALASSGNASDAIQQLEAETAGLEKQAVDALHAWLFDILAALAEFGDWRKPDLTTALAALGKAAADAHNTADLAILLPSANSVALQLRTFAAITAPLGVAETYETAAHAAPATLKPLLEQEARSADTSAALSDPLAVLRRLSELRRTVEAAILRQMDTADLRVLLQTGDVTQAVQTLPNAPPHVVAKPALGFAAATFKPVDRTPSRVIASTATPTPRLLALPRLQISEVQTATLVWPAGAAPPAGDVAWAVAPVGVVSVVGSGVTAEVTGRHAGYCTLTASGSGWRVPFNIVVGDPTIEAAAVAAQTSGWVSGALTVITLLTTTALGYAIFHPAWLGTFNDDFGVIVWGMFGQFGLERVRTAVQPVVAKTFSA